MIAQQMYSDRIHVVVFLICVLLFGIWNLYYGLRNGRTWLIPLARIVRSESPWSYWAAIAIWMIVTGGLFVGFVGMLLGFYPYPAVKY